MGKARIIRKRLDRYTPAVLRCSCGYDIELVDGLDNPCDECGANYNMSGQRVLLSTDPRVEEYYDDDY